MEVIVIGKPAINVYMPLQAYPQEGEVWTITGKNESVGSVGAVSACLLAKWGIKPHYTGVVGNDAYGEKIRNTFSEYKVNNKFMETNFEHGTSTNYFILNTKTGDVTKILYNDPNVELTKFKYDFQPDWAIIDGNDTAGAMALLNNDGKVKTVFFARKADTNTITLAKKCHYVVCSQTFLEGATKLVLTPEATTEDLVSIYQKLVDVMGNSNFIVLLNSKKVLYCDENKVKMLPEMKINHADVSSFDSVFTGSFTYAMMRGLNLDKAITFANTAAAISLSKIGEEPAIPTLDEVLENTGLRDDFNNPLPEQTAQVETPQEEVQQEAPVEEAPQVNAFGQAPVGSEEVSTPEQVAEQQAAPVAPVQEAPAPAPAAEEVAPPPHEETNIFG